MADEQDRDRDRHGRYTVDEFELEERRQRVVKLHVDGFNFREIAKQIGISLGQAHKDFRAVLERTKAEADSTMDEERRVSLARIDRAMKALMPEVDNGNLEAMDRLDKLERRRASLLGLDAPTRQELSGPAGAPIEIDARSALVSRLASLAAGATPAGAEESDSSKPDG